MFHSPQVNERTHIAAQFLGDRNKSTGVECETQGMNWPLTKALAAYFGVVNLKIAKAPLLSG